MKPLTGKTLADVAKMRNKDSVDTALDLLVESDVGGRRHLLPDVRGQHQEADHAAVGVLRLGRGLGGARGRLPEVQAAPARLRELRPRARQVRPRGEGAHAAGRDPQALEPAGDEPGARPPRLPDARHVRRRRRVRSRDDRRDRRRTRSRSSTPWACATCSSTACTCSKGGEPTGAPAGRALRRSRRPEGGG